MIPQSRFSERAFGRLAGVGLAAAAILLLFASCSDSDSTDECWIDVDTLHVSGMAVADTAGVRTVFEAYIDSVHAAGGPFPGGEADWQYAGSRFNREWQGRRYWEVTHRVLRVEMAPVLRRTLQVDENGVLVRPLGCI
jgi:hypothetical protein